MSRPPVCTVYATNRQPEWTCDHDQTSGEFGRLTLAEQIEACLEVGQCLCMEHDPID